jgi:alkaline phosphatase D
MPSDSTTSSARRRLLAAACSLAATDIFLPSAARLARAQAFRSDPFTLGVASGCPRPDGVVLWTRLAPEPLAGGGMPAQSVEVRWQIARDERFQDLAGQGIERATPELAHSVHVQARGLEADRPYWYRFIAGGVQSPVGRTRTAPAATAPTSRLRLAFASCQQFEQGFFGAYRHMTQEDVDLVIHLGDYIYESSWGRNHVRKHAAPEPKTLAGYRDRHAQYKTDPDLQAMHAQAPWLVTWDDHEVANDYADGQGQYLEPDFLERRAAAYRAYYEHMPLERTMLAHAAQMRLHERFQWGRLALIHMLDDRQYRHVQVCPSPKRGGGSNVVDDEQCPERHAPERSLLGSAQERWLEEGLAESQARWNVLGQQTIMAQIDRLPGPGMTHWTDSWDGYPAARKRLLDFIAARRLGNTLVIGGDVHSHWVCDLKQDFNRTDAPTVATEFVGTSITSQAWAQARNAALLPDNPHVKFASSERRGYVVMELSERACNVRLRGIANEKRRDTDIATQAAFVVEHGRPGALPA